MKTNGECFESLMRREKAFKDKKKKRTRIVASVLPAAACIVMILWILPMMLNGNSVISGGDSIVLNPALTGTGMLKQQGNSDKIYTETWDYEKVCTYFGIQTKLSVIPDGYILDGNDDSYQIRMLNDEPYYPLIEYRYIQKSNADSRVYFLVSKHDPSGSLGDIYIKVGDSNEKSIISGTEVIIYSDDARTVYQASFCKDGIYRLLYGFDLSEGDFISFIKSAIG